MIYELKEYSFGGTIGKGFNLYFDNFLQIFLISLLCQIPLMLVMPSNNWVMEPGRVERAVAYIIQIAAFALLNVIIQAFLSAFVISLISQKFLENSGTVFEAKFTSILRLIFPVAGLSLLVGLLTFLGGIALIIPGIIIALGYSIAVNVMVIERENIRNSMRRSWELTRGAKGRIFGLLLVAGIIVACIRLPLLYLLQTIFKKVEFQPYLEMFVSALLEPIYACILVVVYFNLRIKKEGFNIEHLTKQFELANDYGSAVEG